MIKKFFSLVILTGIISLQLGVVAFSDVIEDDVAAQAFNGKSLFKPACSIEIIEDGLAKDLQGKSLSVPANKPGIIEDDIANKAFQGLVLSKPIPKSVLIEDEVAKNLGAENLARPQLKCKLIDENAEIVKVSVYVVNSITAEDLQIGQNINFKIKEDVSRNGKIFIKKDTSVTAFIENIAKVEKYGDPEEIEAGRFITTDVDGNIVSLSGIVRKQGANRAKWAKPIFWAGYCTLPFGAPLMLTYFVKGGKAKITPKQNYKLYYE